VDLLADEILAGLEALDDDPQQIVGIAEGLVRLSIGLENLDDILAGVMNALPAPDTAMKTAAQESPPPCPRPCPKGSSA